MMENDIQIRLDDYILYSIVGSSLSSSYKKVYEWYKKGQNAFWMGQSLDYIKIDQQTNKIETMYHLV